MLLNPKVDDLLEKAENRYELAVVVSKRARQIVAGSKPMVNTNEKSPITIASMELKDGDLFAIKDEQVEKH